MGTPVTKGQAYGLLGAIVFVTLAVIGAKMIPDEPSIHPEPVPYTNDGDVIVTALTESRKGQLVVFDATRSDCTKLAWEIVPPTPDFLVIEDGRRAVFSSPSPGEYLVLVFGFKGETLSVKKHTITVIDSEPKPQDSIATKVSAWCEDVQSPTKRDDLLKLSQSFSSVRASIDAGLVVTPEAILQATIASNQAALAQRYENWSPFMEKLREELNAIAKSGGLDTPQQHAKVWDSIADGLRQYAETLKVSEKVQKQAKN